VVGNDLSKLILDVLGVERLATDAAKSVGSLVELALLDPVTGRLGEESKTNGEDDGPEELDANGDTVGASVATVLGCVHNAVGDEDTNSDAELVTSNDSTANLLGGNLGHVQNDNGRDKSDTETSNETTSSHHTKTSGGNLKDTADTEDGTSENDGETTANEVGKITGNDGTEESTGRQDGGDERLVRGGDRKLLVAIVDNQRVLGTEAGELDVGVFVASVLLDEVVHVEDTSHPTSVIAEEDTTESCKGNNQVGSKGNWGFDTADISCAGNWDNTAAGHLECGAVRLLERLSEELRLFVQEEESRAAWKEDELGISSKGRVGDPKLLISCPSSRDNAAGCACVASG
jgi:hypothetical protein